MKPLLIIASVLLATHVLADPVAIGPNTFAVGVDSEKFDFVAARQLQTNWCWAACIEMVLRWHGLKVSQEEVVQRIFGDQENSPGNQEQILKALSGWAPDTRGRFSGIYASPYILRGSDIARDLGNYHPIIIGLKNEGSNVGHAVVLTAAYYTVGPMNEPIFYKMIIRDPWPDNDSRQELSWNEFNNRVMFAARVFVRPL